MLVTLTGESKRVVVVVVRLGWDRNREWALEPLYPSGGHAVHWLSTWEQELESD